MPDCQDSTYSNNYRPLWMRKVPRYPVYWKGNPQLRIFLPQFWMKMIKPPVDVPPDRVVFIVHPQMSKMDVQNYLEKIYSVYPIAVRTDVRQGDDIKNPNTGTVVGREPDYKMAFIQLKKGEHFEFPDIFEKKVSPMEKQSEDYKKAQKRLTLRDQQEWEMSSIPRWFR